MILYHGTNADFDRISLAIGLRYKDFGRGFYATPDRKTAVRMAQKKARLFGGTPTLITYELDEAALPSNLKIKRFPETATVEWFLFVDANRDRKNDKPIHDYDIVIGPIANDGVVLQLTNYREGYLLARRGCPPASRPLPGPAVLLRNRACPTLTPQNQRRNRMKQPTHHQIANYLTDYALSELVKYVMEDTGCSIEAAMERVYNSPLMTALQDEEGELYVQSPAYLYEQMKKQAAEDIAGR